MTDQPSEAQLRERAKWSASSQDIAETMTSAAFNSNSECNAIQFGKPHVVIAPQGDQYWQGIIPPGLVTLCGTPIEARVKALEVAMAALHDRLVAAEVAVEKPAPEPPKPAEPKPVELPIHAAIRASNEPKPMVGPMGNPQPK